MPVRGDLVFAVMNRGEVEQGLFSAAGPSRFLFDGERSRRATVALDQTIERFEFEVHLAGIFPMIQPAAAHLALGECGVGPLILSIT